MLIRLLPGEIRTLQLRYGLLDGQASTPEEVGRKMGVTLERVRQMEAQALSQLMTNWPIRLKALRRLWEMGKISELKSPFYVSLKKNRNQ